MFKDFSKLCLPAKIYFTLSVVASIIALFNSMPVLAVLMKLIFAFIWTVVLAWICKKGYETVSWILVLLPFVLMVLGYLGMVRLTRKQKNMVMSEEQQKMFQQ